METNKTIDDAEAQTAAATKLGLKEMRMAMGDKYKPIMTLEEAATVSRLAKKTLQKKVAGFFARAKHSSDRFLANACFSG